MDSLVGTLVPRANRTAIGCMVATCDVSLSTYGYFPSKPANIAFLVIFVLSFIGHAYQGIRWKSWTFLIALGVGTLMEAIGYYGRIRMNSDPFNRANLGINIVCLTVAPAFIAGGIYLTLKHLVIILGVKFSRFPPKWYTRIFISCDILSIAIQATGAALSAQGGSIIDTANSLMEVGIVFQVVTLLIFGLLGAEFGFHVYKYRKDLIPSSDTQHKMSRIKNVAIAVGVTYIAVLIRCVYRIAEMAGGWRNPIMQNQALFIVLDSVMCVIAVLALNAFHPGTIFEQSRLALKEAGSDSNSREMQIVDH